MIDIIFLIYENYRIYVLLAITVVCAAVLVYFMFKKKEIGVKKKTAIITLMFILCCSATYFVYRMPIGYDEVSITVEGNEEQDCTINITSIEASRIYRLTFKMIEGNWERGERGYIYSSKNDELSDEITILMPHGYDRKLFFRIEENADSIIVDYEGNITYHKAPEGEIYIEIPSNRARVYFIEFMIQMILCIFAGGLIAFVVKFLLGINYKFIKEYLKEHVYGVGIFLLFCSDFILNKSEQINTWVAPMYTLDYSYGFGSRFFIGSILKVIFGEYIYAKNAYLFCEVTMFMTIVLLSWIIGKVIQKAENNTKIAVVFLVLMYVCSPGAISSMWTRANMGRLENYTFLLVLIGVCLFEIIKEDWVKYSLITFISCICFAIYQGYIFLYFPVMFFIMLYDVFFAVKAKKRKILLQIGSLVINGIAFIVFQFFTYTNFSSYDEMVKVLSQKTDIMICDSLNFEYFMSIKDAYDIFTEDFILSRFSYPRESLFLTVCLCLPIFVVWIAVWLKSLQKLEKKDACRFFYYLWELSYIAFLPQFVLNVDWGRWCIAIIFYSFFAILYMGWKGNKEIVCALERLQEIIMHNKYTMVLILIYLHRFEKFPARDFISSVQGLWENIRVMIF